MSVHVDDWLAEKTIIASNDLFNITTSFRFDARFRVSQCEQTLRICIMLCNELNMPFIDLSHLSENS